jgi:protein phosphatase
VFGISLNRQVQGSCDPKVTTCDKFYVEDLKQLGRETVREGTESFDNIPAARQFIRDLRTKYPLPPCDSLAEEEGQTTTTTSAPPTTTTGQPTSGAPTPGTTTGTPSSDERQPVEAKPGENCREPREGGG